MNQGSTMAPQVRWEGGVTPFGMSWQKLMMWLFLVTDALLFAGFLTAYAFVRLAGGDWPDQGDVFTMPLIGAMTFTLITSSATMATAVGAAHRKDLKTAVRFLLFTALGGAAFLGMQVFEWTEFIHEGARLGSNPWGPGAFSSFFFMITGFHGTHVLIGVVILLITATRVRSGKATGEGVELAGLYWHFVDLVWVFIFTVFYLI
ncbi:MAG: cytochrome c oxidase subunit 3 [Gemmatimonadetes bacterium]|nr:cytochrome c oxidase subunit 3 [Gemmatimonadota bacterium]